MGHILNRNRAHKTKCFTCGRTLFFTEVKTESNWASLLNANLSSYEINAI